MIAENVSDHPQIAAPTMTATMMLELFVSEPIGHCSQHFNFNVTHKLAKRFRMIKESLHDSGATYDDGNGSHHVDSDADVFRWWLANMDISKVNDKQ